MLRIAICDDEENQLRKTAALLEDYLRIRPECSGQVETFLAGETLLKRAEAAGGFDLYILDILMPDLSGIDVGRKLRQLENGGEIIYLTTSNDFAADSYEVQAFFTCSSRWRRASFPCAGRRCGKAGSPSERGRRGVHGGRTAAAPAGAYPLCRAGGAFCPLLLHRRHGGLPKHPRALQGSGGPPAG